MKFHRSILIILALFVLAGCSGYQEDEILTFEKTFDNSRLDIAYSVQQTSDGGFIITGLTFPGLTVESNHEVYLIKTDIKGNEQWSKTFGGPGHDRGWFVQQTNDGGYIIGGEKEPYEDAHRFYAYIIKTDANGVEQWSHEYDKTGRIYSIKQTYDCGYIAVGGTAYNHAFLLKCDPEGNLEWLKQFNESDEARGLIQTRDGGYIIAGHVETERYYSDIVLIKTDAQGNLEWTKMFGNTGEYRANAVQQTFDGGYIIAGSASIGEYWREGNEIKSPPEDIYLIKTDYQGEMEWERTFGGGGADIANSLQQTKDGGYILACETLSYHGGAYLIKTNGKGKKEWDRKFGGSTRGEAKSVQQTVDGGILLQVIYIGMVITICT